MGNVIGIDIRGDEESMFNVLAFCDRKTRAAALFVSKRYLNIFTTDVSFRWRLERLHVEHGIYFPSCLSKEQTWRSLYLGLDKKRHLWEMKEINSMTRAEEGKFKISVLARFKPKKRDCDLLQRGHKAVLPLHQRLALIRIDKSLNSNKEALCELKEQGGWFKEKWDEIEQKQLVDEKEHRDMRPSQSLTSGLKHIDEDNARVIVVDSTKGLREFEFDTVMKDTISQKDVYAMSTHGLVCDVINGVSATCLVYGQTGSGKTYTMFGAQEDQEHKSSLAGIVPRACSELMSAVEYRHKVLNLTMECNVCVSYVEIYGNEILDLLKGGNRVGQSKVSAQRFVLDGNAEVPVTNIEQVMRLLSIGEAQKRKGATAMNLRSSRAHSVFILTLTQKCVDTGKTIQSKFFLADLGGCEQTKKSELFVGRSSHIEALKELAKSAEADIALDVKTRNHPKYSTGFVKSDRMREAAYINLGLMSLKSCVEALIYGRHVPYANSKLTMLLSSGLGGSNKTVIIVCAAQEDEHSTETINAFKFGQACRRVTNSVRSQVSMLDDLMNKLDFEIRACENRIRKNERWELQEHQVFDSLAEKGTLESEGFGGVEIRKTTVLVGAETDRKLLHKLLLKKSQLSGSPSLANKIESNNNNVFGGNIGFGKAHEYGLGEQFMIGTKENYRFSQQPSDDLVPAVVKSKRLEVVPLTAAKKSCLAYSGISA